MSISATSANYSYLNATNTTSVTARKTSLGSEDFMKLLAVQFQSQDPMKPMEDTAFIAQMAQFSALEQSTDMLTEMGLMRTEQQTLLAQGYLGQRLTVSDGDGNLVTGEVTGIEYSTDGPRVVIGEYSYALSSVLLSEPGSASTQTTTADETPAA